MLFRSANNNNEVLISQRAQEVHLGGLWEFPGGKVEVNENVYDALLRESKEELGIQIEQAEQYLKIQHNYSDKSVLLDVWKVNNFSGEPYGMENQLIKWHPVRDLSPKHFPEANMPSINSLKLPEQYMITGKFESHDDFRHKLTTALLAGKKIVQLRCKTVKSDDEYIELAEIAREICAQFNTLLLLNTSVDVFNRLDVSGLHLNSQALFEYESKPIASSKLLSVSCHDETEILQAEKLGADIILLSPVKETSSHPGVQGIGWQRFNAIKQNIKSPVYALGGMKQSDLAEAKQAGAQGVAAISAFWLNE
mgnify:CR=1 FL=1